jgi:putative ABC transport system permease protein
VRLHRVVDAGGHAVAVPANGVLLSSRLAATLGVNAGDRVMVEVLEGTRPVAEVPVTATVDDLLGVQATMAAPALAHLLDEGPRVSGAWLAADPARQPALYPRLAAMPRVASVSLRSATLPALRRMLDDSLLWFTAVLTAFAMLIAAGVVYNTARITVAERERELATLRVIGFTTGETWRVVAGTVAAEVAVAIPWGWVLGWGFTWITARATASELMRIPVVMNRASCAEGALVVVAASIAAMALAGRWLRRLDLVSVLKAKE